MRKKIMFILMLVALALPMTIYAQEEENQPMLPDELIAQFEYDQTADLQITEVSSEIRGDITIKEITYASPVDGEPIEAYLVLPAGNGPFPGVLYVHWYEPAAQNSNRTEFLDEAVLLAEEGVISLLPATMWSVPTWYRQGRTLESDYQDAINQVIALRRALDVLYAQSQLDPDHMAYVGHDFGAMYGTLMGAVDQRPDAYVLIAGASDFNKWMLFGVDQNRAGLDEYKAQMAELAPSRFVPFLNAPLLFQFGTEDFYTPVEDYNAFFAAAVEPKQMRLYDTEHAMDLRSIQDTRLNFLREQLDLIGTEADAAR